MCEQSFNAGLDPTRVFGMIHHISGEDDIEAGCKRAFVDGILPVESENVDRTGGNVGKVRGNVLAKVVEDRGMIIRSDDLNRWKELRRRDA